MLFKDAIFIGIDPPSGEKSLTYAALDQELNLIALARGDLNTVSAFAGGQNSAFVAVNAPRRVNQGLMNKESVRNSLSPQPNPGRWTTFRVAEYSLFQRNIRIVNTPGDVESCSGWMRTGFLMYQRLQDLGYKDYPAENHKQQVLEVYPHAAFTVLLKRVPYLKKTLEGRLQRQLILHSLSVDVPDPMRIFEEFTRYKILQGQLPLDGLFSVEELEALIAAYIAWKAAVEPDEITRVGDPKEGEIVLPGTDLKSKYY
ncbi:MAG: DUF429 domain-containing protein [Anaerolineales bacterium]|nr:DUF429 domain-containing protein [Anaerolineales bacterium]